MFDFTINLSIVFQTIVTLATIAFFILKIHTDLKLLVQSHNAQNTKINNIETRIDKLSGLVVDLARQDQRLNNLESRITELSSTVFNLSQRETVS